MHKRSLLLKQWLRVVTPDNEICLAPLPHWGAVVEVVRSMVASSRYKHGLMDYHVLSSKEGTSVPLCA